MFDDTLTLRSGSSLPAPVTVRVIDIFEATAVCTAIGGTSRGLRLESVTIATTAMITTAMIQRAIVMGHQVRREA